VPGLRALHQDARPEVAESGQARALVLLHARQPARNHVLTHVCWLT
jgi:hypothetical protein